LPHAAKTDIMRREDRVLKAEAKLPANMDNIVAQMTGRLGVQQATHALDADDKRNADHLESACEGLNMWISQAAASTNRGAKRLRQNEDEGQ